MNMQFPKTFLATAIAISALAIGAPVVADTAAQNITEARQETQIWTTYALSPYLRANDLKVSVKNGKATLTGTVEEDVNKDLAKQIALGVSGIQTVDNQIKVQADYTPPQRGAERSFGEVIDDATITAVVKSKLVWSKHTDGMVTGVDTKSGTVTLIGSAENAQARELAGRLAKNTDGVVAVNNQLVVKNEKPTAVAATKAATKETGRDMSDSWITTKVKSTFMFSSNVKGSDIDVSTKDGIVTLTGKVDSGAERELAIELANNVRGGKSVQSKGLTK
jgi:osmotically-inducible protein OsmY